MVYGYESLFDKIVNQLSEGAIAPFQSNFKQFNKDYNLQSLKLLELVLKACLISGNLRHTESVLIFARNHNYLLAIDE